MQPQDHYVYCILTFCLSVTSLPGLSKGGRRREEGQDGQISSFILIEMSDLSYK